MKLRSFLFGLLALTGLAVNAAESGKEYYELRVYTTKSADQQKRVNEYWERAGVPAYNKLGAKPVGVFTEVEDSETNKIYVLIPFESANAAVAAAGKLAADADYQKNSADFMGHARTNAPYVRFESWLLVAMEGMKKLAVPPSTAEKQPWVFELRTYFSPNEAKGINKVDMFNDGEIVAMQEVGLSPVFFAQTVIGPQMPSLVYMVSGANKEQHSANFRKFGQHPAWRKIVGDPKYKDNMAGIKNAFLKRTSASQI